MKIIGLVTAVFIACSFSAQGQRLDRNIARQHNAWFPLNASLRFSEKFGLSAEYQFRASGPLEETQQHLLRAGIDHFINESASLTAGYALVVTYPYGEQPVAGEFMEHRAWQQALLSHKTGRVAISHRYRLEQRWIETVALNEQNWTYFNRMRYRVWMSIPLNKPAIEPQTLFAAVANEAFVSFGKNVRYNVFDQNRFYTGLGYQATAALQVQAGYLNQTIYKANGRNMEINHTWQLGMTWKLDLRKKETS